MLSYMQPEDGLEYQTTAPEYPAAEQLHTEQCYKQNKERRITRLFYSGCSHLSWNTQHLTRENVIGIFQ